MNSSPVKHDEVLIPIVHTVSTLPWLLLKWGRNVVVAIVSVLFVALLPVALVLLQYFGAPVLLFTIIALLILAVFAFAIADMARIHVSAREQKQHHLPL